MANRDILKEAIADAKAVKETAIANAKIALEEAFTPFLQTTLSTRLAEMDREEMKEDEDNEIKEILHSMGLGLGMRLDQPAQAHQE